MNNTIQAERLQQLRLGFDRVIERLYAEKSEMGYPVVVAGNDGNPIHLPAREALNRFRQKKKVMQA